MKRIRELGVTCWFGLCFQKNSFLFYQTFSTQQKETELMKSSHMASSEDKTPKGKKAEKSSEASTSMDSSEELNTDSTDIDSSSSDADESVVAKLKKLL
jgi:hypothetical protein